MVEEPIVADVPTPLLFELVVFPPISYANVTVLVGVEMVVGLPLPSVMVKLPAASGVVALATVSEDQDAVLAKLLTDTT